MPLGAGGPDTRGVYLFGEEDENTLASDLLNRLGASVSTQFGADRARLDVLETPPTTEQEIAFKPGFTKVDGLGVYAHHRRGIVYLEVNAFYAGWTGLKTICTLPSWARPSRTIPAVGTWSGGVVEIKVKPNGDVTGDQLTATRNGVISSIAYPVSV